MGGIEQIQLDRLGRALRRWALVVVAGALIAGLTALIVSQSLPPEYLATAELYIAPAANPTVAFQDAVAGANVARSYVQLVTAPVVLRPAMDAVAWGDVKTFEDRTRASQLRDTSIITISFRDSDPARAASAATAIAQSFIAQTRQLQAQLNGETVNQLETQLTSVGSEIDSLDGQIAVLRAQLTATPRPGQTAPDKGELQAQLTQLDLSRQTQQQTLAQLLKTRGDMRLAAVRAESTVSLWQPATVPDQPVGPRVALNTLVALLAGAFVSVSIIAFVTYFDDRVNEPEEVQSSLGLPPLALINLGERPESFGGKLFVRDTPRSPEAESFRSLRTNIQFANVDKRPRTILVTSALPREGKSVISANLALAFAQGGAQTILIDADLRRPSQHRLFGVSASIGLTSLLTDAIPANNLARFEVGPHLFVIPSGPLPPNPAELLSSSKMSWLLGELAGPETTVIVDTSPVLAATDAVALATKVDGAVFVVDSEHTRTRVARRAIDNLRRVHADVFGAVLNKVDVSHVGYYYYYYGPSTPARPVPQARR